jgi:galactitol-specific phosphotransferase system IIC component
MGNNRVKVLGCLLIIMLLSGFIGNLAFALEVDRKLAVGAISYGENHSVQIPIVLYGDGAVASFQLDITFNSDMLQFESYTVGESISSFNISLVPLNATGKLRAIVYNIQGQKIPQGRVILCYVNFSKLLVGTSQECLTNIVNVMMSDITATDITNQFSVTNRNIFGTQRQNIFVSLPIYKDTNQNQIPLLRSGDIISTATKVTNMSDANISAILTVVLYDESNRMIKVNSQTKDIEKGKMMEFSVDTAVPQVISGWHIKAFVWNSIDFLRPLAEVDKLY